MNTDEQALSPGRRVEGTGNIRRIAHITDLHMRNILPGTSAVCVRRSRDMATLFPQALEKIRAQKPDFLAVTGDLLDVPMWAINPIPGFAQDQVEFWHDAALKDYRAIRQWLNESGIPWMVLPGNHDCPRAFADVFGGDPDVMELKGWRFVRFCDHEHAGNQPRRFNPVREHWEKQLADKDSPLQVHLQHYVVTPALNGGYPHTYEEGEELARRTNACGHVRLSLSGHYHRGTPLLDHGNTTFTTAPAFCESPFQWRVYELNDDGRVTMETHQIGVPKKRPVVFLDRDGVINEQPSYREGPERLTLVPGSAKAIRSFNEAGRAVVVITNQSAIGYGYVSEAVVASVNDKLCRLLAEQGAYLDAIYYDSAAGAQAVLPQYLDDSRAKPSPHMLLQAAAELNLDLENSWMVGDNSGDIAAGKAIGAKTILVQSGNGKNAAAEVKQRWPDTPCLPDLNSATTKILE